MSRIFIPTSGRWYDELKAVAYYGETELESWIQQHAHSLFPHHYAIPFKKNVTSKSTGKNRKPDLALIRRDFSAWVVVEVELERHELDHVLEQARVFLDGKYNFEEIAQYVRDQLLRHYRKRVPLSQLEKLFDSHFPSVLVITDEHTEDWQKELRKLGVQFCIFEIYKNVFGSHVYRTFGDYPLVHVEDAHCRPHPSIRNVIEVVGNFTFTKISDGGRVEVFYDEYLTRWCLLKEPRKQYLRFVGKSNPLTLSPSDTYGLYRDKSNKYYFKRS